MIRQTQAGLLYPQFAGGLVPVGAALVSTGSASFYSGTYFFQSKGLSREMHDLANLTRADKPLNPRDKK